MNSNDRYRQFQESLEHIQGRFHVLETDVPVEKQMEYFRFSEKVRRHREKPTVEEAIEILYSENTTDRDKKYAMTVLAISGEVKAFRALEAYNKNTKEDLKDWSGMSFLQAKMTLESEFSDEKFIFISTGLGGKGDMLRFFAFFKSKKLRPFSSYQIQLIEKEIPFSVSEAHGVVEKLEIFENYFTLLFLINIKSNIKNVLEDALIECNQYGDFIDRSFIITNVKVFDEEDIKYELKRNDKVVF